ncbi:CapA family protein, partial [Actinosynnema sp. NPDC023658]|uniref:CapA family protein n=1 Tax=Actinosynnema sp. NPDC023658 TaxID=3155465 RepID=UPI0034081018
AAEAAEPHRREVAGTGVSVLAYTSVDGSFVNESFPAATARQPDDVAESDRWQYQTRTWGYPAAGVPSAPRRIREAWERFSAAEERASDEQVAGMWASLAAVYPEVQDWVARRGHGGAARWDDKGSTAQIKRAAGASPLVMVQLHAGFQFQDAASDNMRDIAHQAIDAGADIVVAHHPHVLQGLEWYKGKLIAYSLGNFVFEQNFLATFASAFLRTVWEGDTLLEARLFPLELVDYKPVPVTDSAAERVLARVWERSVLPLESYRDDSGDIRTRPRAVGTPAQVVLERHTGRLVTGPTAQRTENQDVPPGAVVDLPVVPSALVKPTGGGVDVGRDLYGWGHFEDETADAAVSEAVHWSVNSKREGVRSGDAAGGLRALRLEVREGDAVQSRPIARIALPRHRAYDAKAVPTDPEPSYSLVTKVRRSSSATAEARFDIYHFDDSNPAEDPTSEVVATYTKPVDVPADGQWHQVVVDLSLSELDTGPTKGNMVMPYLKVTGSSAQPAWVDVDDLRFVEWRAAQGMTGAYGAFTLARNRGGAPARLPYEVLLPSTP